MTKMTEYPPEKEEGFFYEETPENYLEVLAEIRAELGKQRLEGANE